MRTDDVSTEHDHVDHDHHHGHSYSPGGQSQVPADFGCAFAIGAALNTFYVALEVTFGLLSGLLADAGHKLSDVLRLLLAWGASWLAKQPQPGPTYGYKRGPILASLAARTYVLEQDSVSARISTGVSTPSWSFGTDAINTPTASSRS